MISIILSLNFYKVIMRNYKISKWFKLISYQNLGFLYKILL